LSHGRVNHRQIPAEQEQAVAVIHDLPIRDAVVAIIII